jgi:hypothetical protein
MALISTLTDNFNDNSIDGAKWTATAGIVETNNQLELTSDAYAIRRFDSVSSYDLTGSQVTIKLVTMDRTFWFQVYKTLDDDALEFVVDGGGNLVVNTYIATDLVERYSTAYVAATHKYLRIRESGGNCYFDYSTDGISWTNVYSIANPFVITAMYAELGYSSSSTTTAKVDDFNILPSATAKHLRSLMGVGL